MNVFLDRDYQEFLLSVINNDNKNLDKNIKKQLKLNIYLSLLSLNNHNYQEIYYESESNIIDDFLRKVNNLKVKIQLKRKNNEIDKLREDILEIYHFNTRLIDKYNKNNRDIEKIIISNDTELITGLIDDMTMINIIRRENKNIYDEERIFIIDNIFDSTYYIVDNYLYIIYQDKKRKILLDDFYQIFDYLLDIDNYKQVYLNDVVNNNHLVIVNNLINLIISNDISNNLTNREIIPLIFTNLLTNEIINLDQVDTSNFKIDNIKITDLYSFAKDKYPLDEKMAKWNKIVIPNEYLYSKIKELIKKGMYYYSENSFTLENIDNKISDFKISIDIDKSLIFLENLINKSYSN